MNRDSCILITGSNGFVGRHLTAALNERFGPGCRIVATGRHEDGPSAGKDVVPLDVTDDPAVDAAIADAQPTHVIHLSAISSPNDATADPRMAWAVNTLGTLSVAEAILRHVPDCRLLFASTGLVYGNSLPLSEPFTETSQLAPTSEYAVTKTAADLLIGAMANKGLRSTRLRLFNHTGPGQSELFVVPRFAAQIARIEKGLQPPIMQVGNLEALRDMMDVRDVVEAYILAIEQSDNLEPAGVLNISTGKAHNIGEMLSILLGFSSASISIKSLQGVAAGGADQLVGDPTLAGRLLKWRARHELRETLKSVLDYFRERSLRETNHPGPS
jgi:GDP-4-dehydro-6-deoxy-D-mannose reductase